MFTTACPSCSSPVVFKSEFSVYASCSACGSVVVRHDVDISVIGKVAELQPDGSPFQLGTTGTYKDKRFEVVGRLQITYGDGFWNEWFLQFDDGKSGWLGEAMGEYFVNFSLDPGDQLPAFEQLELQETIRLADTNFVVTNKRQAAVVGFEGELPFHFASGYILPYIDLRSATTKGATLDYSEPGKPQLYVGEYVTSDELNLQNIRRPEDIEAQALQSGKFLKTLQCPNCGAPHELRGGPRTNTLACEFCDAVIDVSNPELNILYRAEKAYKIKPTIPLGATAQLGDDKWTHIGFLQRSVVYDGIEYKWSEYLLHNHLKGYAWLLESEGHWTLQTPIAHIPLASDGDLCTFPTREYIIEEGKQFRHFQSSTPKTVYVAGEFYWRVRVGDEADTHDYVCPPEIISLETTNEGVYWTKGIYLTGSQVWQMFNLSGSPPVAVGVAPAQPNPYREDSSKTWKTYAVAMAISFVLMIFLSVITPGKIFYSRSHRFFNYKRNPEVISAPFKISGRTSGLNIHYAANIYNRWVFVSGTLVNQTTKKSYPFGKTLSFYYGSGSRRAASFIPSVPPGTYVIRYQADSGSAGYSSDIIPRPAHGKKPVQLFTYKVWVSRAGPAWGTFFLVAFLLLILPAWLTINYWKFEHQRWLESDHAAI